MSEETLHEAGLTTVAKPYLAANRFNKAFDSLQIGPSAGNPASNLKSMLVWLDTLAATS